MKKVKFMLLSLALVAVVGGALAFKAKTAHRFCSTIAHNVGGVSTCKVDNVVLKCPDFISKATIGGSTGDFYCTAPTNGDACDVNQDCLDQAPIQTIVDGN
jgi:hypothetical protein